MSNEERIEQLCYVIKHLAAVARLRDSDYDWIESEANEIIEDIRNAPAADVVEVVHGEWKTDRFGLERSICSVCGAVYEGDGGNYCPNCGVKMDKEN